MPKVNSSSDAGLFDSMKNSRVGQAVSSSFSELENNVNNNPFKYGLLCLTVAVVMGVVATQAGSFGTMMCLPSGVAGGVGLFLVGYKIHDKWKDTILMKKISKVAQVVLPFLVPILFSAFIGTLMLKAPYYTFQPNITELSFFYGLLASAAICPLIGHYWIGSLIERYQVSWKSDRETKRLSEEITG